jgi:hypothetical protein
VSIGVKNDAIHSSVKTFLKSWSWEKKWKKEKREK